MQVAATLCREAGEPWITGIFPIGSGCMALCSFVSPFQTCFSQYVVEIILVRGPLQEERTCRFCSGQYPGRIHTLASTLDSRRIYLSCCAADQLEHMFCRADWRQVLTPNAFKCQPVVPVLSIYYGGMCTRIRGKYSLLPFSGCKRNVPVRATSDIVNILKSNITTISQPAMLFVQFALDQMV